MSVAVIVFVVQLRSGSTWQVIHHPVHYSFIFCNHGPVITSYIILLETLPVHFTEL